MAGLLSGLEQFGLTNLENADLYEQPKKEEPEQVEQKVDPVQLEKDYLFEKSYTCPVCDNEFKAKTVKMGKAKFLGSDMDLRPRYEHIDMLKYDILLCPKCGYAALGRFFKYLTSMQVKQIKENISASFKEIKDEDDIYTYEKALGRYKLALANAIVKKGKASEKAYICLKAAWLLRGMKENLDESAADYKQKKAECEKSEMEFLKNAMDGFMKAKSSEGYPMCGMDEETVDYLIAVLAMQFGKYDIASKLIASILTSKDANSRMKDKARDVKEILVERIKRSKAQS